MVIYLTARGYHNGDPEMRTQTLNSSDFVKAKRKNRPPDRLKQRRKRAKRKKGK